MLPQPGMIGARMFQWKQAGPVCAQVCNDVGRVATTWFRAVAHLTHTWQEIAELTFSVVAIRIGTGRRHQIRTHLTHLGHPTVLDAKYADSAVLEVEAELLGRKVLRGSGVCITAPQLHSRRFRTRWPQHQGIDPLTLNPALLELLGREPIGHRNTGCGFSAGKDSPLPEALSIPPPLSGCWSRDGPCSRRPRRLDTQGRDMDRCLVCGGFGHWSRSCPNGGKDRCLVCGDIGHRAKDCPEGGDTCLLCGKVGHQQRDCPRMRQGSKPWLPTCFDFKTEGKCRLGSACPFSHQLS